MSKLNSLNLPAAKLQENPIVNDLSVLSTNFPPPTTAGAILIGPNAVDPAPNASIAVGLPAGIVGPLAAPGGNTYYYIPATVRNGAGAPVTGFLMFSTAHP